MYLFDNQAQQDNATIKTIFVLSFLKQVKEKNLFSNLLNTWPFYLLKIQLNLFEISNYFFKFDSSLSHDKVEQTHIAPLRKVHV